MRFFLFLATCLFVGCGAESSDPAEPQASASTTAFDEAIENDPCGVLTPALLSDVVGVPVDRLEQLEVTGLCSYSWDGGQASLGRITVLESAERAQERFDQTYRQMTPEEREQAAEAMREGLERRRAAGELSDEQARMAGGIAGMAGDMAETTEYEPIPDLGDQASYDGTVRTMKAGVLGDVTVAESSLHVRLGNLITTVRTDLYEPGDDIEVIRAGPPPEARQQNRETTIALARAVLDALR